MATILLIEDNSEIRENTEELLSLEGYTILSSVNGSDGVTMAKEKFPDIILCDVMMPEMNGWEVVRTLKADPQTMHIPFIFLSASVERKEIETALGMGADDYIRKPFEADELLRVIRKYLSDQPIPDPSR